MTCHELIIYNISNPRAVQSLKVVTCFQVEIRFEHCKYNCHHLHSHLTFLFVVTMITDSIRHAQSVPRPILLLHHAQR